MGTYPQIVMTHLILSPRHTSDSNTLWKAALDMSWKINRLYKYRIKAGIADNSAKIYGENLFVEIIAQQLEIALLATPPEWLSQLPQEYLKRQVNFMKLKDCRNFTSPKFIKPASGKLFDAKIYNSGEDLPSSDVQDDETPVLVSEPVRWVKEFRCFVHQQELLTLSAYSESGELNLEATDDEIRQAEVFCQTILHDKRIKLPPSTVIDIGVIQKKGWAVVEANPTFASGIYACDPQKVLLCLESACLPADQINDELTQWVMNAG